MHVLVKIIEGCSRYFSSTSIVRLSVLTFSRSGFEFCM